MQIDKIEFSKSNCQKQRAAIMRKCVFCLCFCGAAKHFCRLLFSFSRENHELFGVCFSLADKFFSFSSLLKQISSFPSFAKKVYKFKFPNFFAINLLNKKILLIIKEKNKFVNLSRMKFLQILQDFLIFFAKFLLTYFLFVI